jgi:outer membrane protein assembly factor BamB
VPPPRRRRRLLALLLGVAVVLAGGAAAAAYLVATDEPGDVSNPEVTFVAEPPPPPPRADRFRWPMYGYTKDHRRVYDPPRRLPIRGAWKLIWRHRAPALLEFPPVIHRGAIYQLADNGQLFSLRKRDGRVRWKRKLGVLSASSPAVSGGSIYVTLLERRRGTRRGRVVALRTRDGRIRWSLDLGSRSESSPLLHRGKLYVGTEEGKLLRLDAQTGRVDWTYRAGGAIKASPTLSDEKLYFGDYGGYVHAVRTGDGRRVWRAAPARRLVRSGRFYATAAVAFGRVYLGATDGRQYSLSAADGSLSWARQTGGYVYSSAAVDDVRGGGPTVFFGSYDGWFYALDARSGRTRWRHRSGGRISGAATIIGRTVFFADLGKRVTIGLDTRTGDVAFRRHPGAFDPIISDGRFLFQTGRSSLTALLPVTS